jgi:lambda family phage tail tape measure protein
MAINIARLGVVLGIDTAEFSKGINQAKKSLNEVGAFAAKAGAVATAALTAMTYKALQFSDQMQDLAESTGVGVGKILQMSNAMQRAGGEVGGSTKALTRFAQTIDAAANGSQAAQDSFKQAGVSLKDLASMSVEQLLNKTSQGIANIGDKAQQTGLKMDIFGKSMLTVDMNTFNKNIQQSTEEFTQYEAAIKTAADITDQMEQAANKVGLVFIQKFIPSLNYLLQTLTDKGSPAFDAFNNILDGLAWTVRHFALGINALSAGFQTLSVSTQSFFGKISKDDAWKQMVNIENSLRKQIGLVQELNKPKQPGQVSPLMPAAPISRKIEDSPETKKAKEDAEKQVEMLKVAQLISGEYSRQQTYTLQQIGIRNQLIGLTRDEARVQEAINRVTDETSKKIDEINKLREAAVGRKAGPAVVAEYQLQIDKVRELEAVFIQMAKNQETAAIASQRTFAFGWDRAFNQFAENAYNYAAQAERIFSSLTNSMTNAIDNFVDTGKFAFKDFAVSVIKDLIKIQMRMQAMQLFSSAIGMFGGGGGGPVQLAGPGMPTAADGGHINGPTLVGENGPEIFIPQRSGTVIPNQQISSMGSNQPQNIFNGPYIASLQAIDTQSGIQFLAKNKNAVWSANQSAGRGMPASRT